MTQVACDVDNLKVLFKDGKVCESCGGVPSEYTENGCCRFLDPNTPNWNDSTTYIKDYIVQSGSGYGSFTFKSLQNDNLHHHLDQAAWWLKVSNAVSCGEENWNHYPPYGGPEKTPAYVTVVFSGINAQAPAPITPTSPNRTFILSHESSVHGSCIWSCGNRYPIYPANNWRIEVDFNPSGEWRLILFHSHWEDPPDQQVLVFSAGSYWGCQWGNGEDYTTNMVITAYDGDDFFSYRCKSNHESDSSSAPETGANWSVYWEKLGAFGFLDFIITNIIGLSGGTATIQLGWHITIWVSGQNYGEGNVKSCNSVRYACLLAHLSDGYNRPGTGENWATYWEILTSCV